ncbi:MAG: ABC-F family ATP-binding cassette domain-containing protein [Deltaproteobacteria bacterium]|nr:ABC-F family ATP-binding cassette domain-containing protein [Deltaproteobacteria bacterium]
MPLISAEGISLQFRGRAIFNDANLAIERGDRLGIVGRNGSGKSTLLRILTGEVIPDGGRVNRARACRVGYLAQELSDPRDETLLDGVLARAPGIAELEAEIEELLVDVGDGDESRLLRVADLHETLHELDRRYAPHRAERILSGLGFDRSDFSRKVRTFSGGWRMRAALAGLLFEDPDVLLLDEPTNHLDLPSVRWLDGFLKGMKQSLVLICHDREFLNRHIRRVASLELEGLRQYRGDYDDYLEERAVELEVLMARVKNEGARRKELESFVERFRAKASKARQAQSKAKLIEKMQERQVELPKVQDSIVLRFPPCERAGDVVLSIEGLSFGFDTAERERSGGAPPGDGPRKLFDQLSLTVRRGDRVAIVGRNGSGKTTLLKLIANELTPSAGTLKLGVNVRQSYYAQHHADVLRRDATVLDEVSRAAPSLGQTQLRSICGAFLFSGDDVDKKVGVLSGGEKARVALARMLAAPGNFLLLDEPTNHLDTDSSERLTDSLETYDGTLLFVSHSLDFAKRLSTQVWDLTGGKVEVYPGSLAEYLDKLEERSKVESLDEEASTKAPLRSKDEKKAARRADADRRKERAKFLKPVTDAEETVARLEKEKAELEAALADPEVHKEPSKMERLAKRFHELGGEIERAVLRWEQLEARLQAFDQETV